MTGQTRIDPKSTEENGIHRDAIVNDNLREICIVANALRWNWQKRKDFNVKDVDQKKKRFWPLSAAVKLYSDLILSGEIPNTGKICLSEVSGPNIRLVRREKFG